MKRYLKKIKFSEKDSVKVLGAKWDPAKKRWYVPEHLLLAPFAKWLPVRLLKKCAAEESAAKSEPVKVVTPPFWLDDDENESSDSK